MDAVVLLRRWCWKGHSSVKTGRTLLNTFIVQVSLNKGLLVGEVVLKGLISDNFHFWRVGSLERTGYWCLDSGRMCLSWNDWLRIILTLRGCSGLQMTDFGKDCGGPEKNYFNYHMMPMLGPMLSHDQTSHICPLLDHFDLTRQWHLGNAVGILWWWQQWQWCYMMKKVMLHLTWILLT